MDVILSYKDDTTIEGYTATLQRLEIALMTEKGSISADPDFGFGVSGIVDSQLTPELEYTVKAELLQLVAAYFPDVEILSMKLNKTGIGTLQIQLSIRVLTSDAVLGLNLEYNTD